MITLEEEIAYITKEYIFGTTAAAFAAIAICESESRVSEVQTEVELETFLVKEIDVSAGGQRPWEDKKLVWGEKTETFQKHSSMQNSLAK